MDWAFVGPVPQYALEGALRASREPIGSLQSLCLEALVIRSGSCDGALAEYIIRSSWRQLARRFKLQAYLDKSHIWKQYLPMLAESTPVFLAEVCGSAWMIERLLKAYDRYDVLPYVRDLHQDILKDCLVWRSLTTVAQRLCELGIHPGRGLQQYALLFGSNQVRDWIRANYGLESLPTFLS
jgi:hypothetical protein